MADTKLGEMLAAQVIRCVVSSEASLYSVLGATERGALRLPSAREPFSIAFASFFQAMYTQLCLGQDSSLAQELETMGKPLAHTTFCMLAIVARVCSKVHYGLDRSKLRVETKEAYIESLLEQLEPVTRKVALTTAKHRHICRKPNIPRPNSPFRRSRRKKPARYGPARSDATGAPR